MPRKKKVETRTWLDPYPKDKKTGRHICEHHNIGYDARVSFRAIDLRQSELDQIAMEKILTRMEWEEAAAKAKEETERKARIEADTKNKKKPSLWSRIKTCLTKK